MSTSDSVASEPVEVVLIAGKLLRLRALEHPPGIRESDLDHWVRFAVEEDSPLSLESLFWGFWTVGKTQRVWVYAGWKNRIEAEVGRSLNVEVGRVVPAFFLPRPVSGAEQLQCVIGVGSECYRLHYAAGEMLPDDVEAVAQVPAQYTLESVSGTERLTYRYRKATGDCVVVHLRNKRALLRADVRKGADLTARYQQSRQVRIACGALLATAGLWALLLLLYVAMLFMDANSRAQREELESRADFIEAIRSRHQLVERLERVQTRPWSPFDTLAMLEHFRQEGLYFTALNADATGGVEVRGQAGSVEQVNQYTRSLAAAPPVRTAELADIVSSSKGVVYRLSVQVRDEEIGSAP